MAGMPLVRRVDCVSALPGSVQRTLEWYTAAIRTRPRSKQHPPVALHRAQQLAARQLGQVCLLPLHRAAAVGRQGRKVGSPAAGAAFCPLMQQEESYCQPGLQPATRRDGVGVWFLAGKRGPGAAQQRRWQWRRRRLAAHGGACPAGPPLSTATLLTRPGGCRCPTPLLWLLLSRLSQGSQISAPP